MELWMPDDFDPDRIAESGQCFRWERTEDGGWRIPHRGACLTLRPAEAAGRFVLSCGEAEFADLWRPYFDLDTDYAAIRAAVDPAEEPFLAQACELGRGIRILRQDPWEMLVTAIITQNRNIPAIRRSVALLCAAAGEARTDAEGRPWHSFPAPEALLALSGDALRSCRLGYRQAYVQEAARTVCEGRLDLNALASAPEEETMAALTALYGVGPKVACCVRLFGLHQLDAFPVDVWIRRALDWTYPEGWPAERHRPWNGVYQQYLFYAIREDAGAV